MGIRRTVYLYCKMLGIGNGANLKKKNVRAYGKDLYCTDTTLYSTVTLAHLAAAVLLQYQYYLYEYCMG